MTSRVQEEAFAVDLEDETVGIEEGVEDLLAERFAGEIKHG